MLKLEVFDTADGATQMPYLDSKSAEKLRDAAYEQGYGAGWQDALDQMRDEDALRRAATFEALQALTFTYAEARSMAESQLAAIIGAFLARVVPETCVLSLPGRVAQEVRTLLARDHSAPLQVLCAPDAVPLLGAVLADLPKSAMVALVPEPSFSAAQVMVQGQAQTRSVDLSAMTAALQQALGAPPSAASTNTGSIPLWGAQHG